MFERVQPKNVLSYLNLDINKQKLYQLEREGKLGEVTQEPMGKKSVRMYSQEQLGIIAQLYSEMKKPHQLDDELLTFVMTQAKGGVGKTVHAFLFAYQCALHGLKTLVVGLDEQESITELIKDTPINSLEDLKAYDERKGLYHFLYSGADLDDILVRSDKLENLWCIPETPELEDLNDTILLRENNKITLFKKKLLPMIKSKGFDVLVFDCPPSVSSQLTKNALVAAENVVMPISCQMTAYKGFNKGMIKFNRFREEAEADGHIGWDNLSYIPTMVRSSGNGNMLSAEIHGAIKSQFGANVVKNTRLADIFEKAVNERCLPIQISSNDVQAKNLHDLNVEIFNKAILSKLDSLGEVQ